MFRELTLREFIFSVSEREEFMIKEIKYNDNLYQIENINKEIEIIKKEQWKLFIWKGVNKMKNLVKGLKDRFELTE